MEENHYLWCEWQRILEPVYTCPTNDIGLMIGEYSDKQATTSVTESLCKRYQRLFKLKHNFFNKNSINSIDC